MWPRNEQEDAGMTYVYAYLLIGALLGAVIGATVARRFSMSGRGWPWVAFSFVAILGMYAVAWPAYLWQARNDA